MILAFVIAAAVLIADIISKVIISSSFELYYSEAFIPGILNITNISNDGIAFGMLDNARWLFMAATAVLIVILLGIVIFAKGYHKLVYACAGLVLGGGAGNFVDRILKLGLYDEPGCVVDFIDFCAFPELWRWTFNVADIGVCVGAGLFILYLVAFDKKSYENGLKSVVYEQKKTDGNDTNE